MTYLALLRGINVGGKNKVDMARLRDMFERIGANNVHTYINSGNVIFDHRRAKGPLTTEIEKSIEAEFGFGVRVLLRTRDEVTSLVASVPTSWRDDSTMRCYVMFLWEEVDRASILDQLTIKDEIDDVKYHPGAIVWRVDRDVLTRSGMIKLINASLYKQMTIRTVNTVRKLADLIDATRPRPTDTER